MANKSPAFQFYPQDFLADAKVQVMTTEERGAYITLLCHEWIEGGLPIDEEGLAMLSGARDRWPEIRDRIMVCFKRSGGKASKWINPRLQRERKTQRERRAKRSISGRDGANARWGKDIEEDKADSKCHTEAMAKGMANDGSASSSSSSSSTSVTTEREPPPRASDEIPAIAPDIEALAMQVFGSVPAGRLAEWAGRHPPDWIRAALLATEGNAKHPAYTERILHRYARDGGPKNDDACGKACSARAAIAAREPPDKFAGMD